jgi:hypothetical protein
MAFRQRFASLIHGGLCFGRTWSLRTEANLIQNKTPMHFRRISDIEDLRKSKGQDQEAVATLSPRRPFLDPFYSTSLSR